MEELLNKICFWFSNYVATFRSYDKQIQEVVAIKAEHTEKVRQISHELATHLGLAPRDVMLAEIIAVLHDVGRFSQFAKYRSLIDCKTEDHAMTGLKVIGEQSFVEEFLPEDRMIIFYAIQYHNKKSLAFSPNPRALFFAKLLRDADKMDIYRVLEPYLRPSDGKGISPIFLRNFLAGVQCNYSDCRTEDDKKIIRLMWAYDINFSWTLEKIARQGYFEVIYRNLPHTPEITQGMQRLVDYVVKKCSQPDRVNFAELSQEAKQYIVNQ